VRNKYPEGSGLRRAGIWAKMCTSLGRKMAPLCLGGCCALRPQASVSTFCPSLSFPIPRAIVPHHSYRSSPPVPYNLIPASISVVLYATGRQLKWPVALSGKSGLCNLKQVIGYKKFHLSISALNPFIHRLQARSYKQPAQGDHGDPGEREAHTAQIPKHGEPKEYSLS